MKKLILSALLAISIFATGYTQTTTYEREVIVQLLPGTLKIPAGKTEARLENLTSIPLQLRTLLSQFNTEEVAKTFPAFERRDTLKISRTGERVTLSDLSDIFTLRLPSSAQKNQLIERLAKLPFVVYAEPNGGTSPSVLPNDEYFDNPSSPGSGGRQWSLLNTGQDLGTYDADIDAPEAWDITKGSSSTVIGIIDGGVENWHEDLSGKVTGDAGWGWNGHGFHVAGIAAAKTNNTDGIAGVDWNAQIISQRVDNTDDPGTYNAIMDALTAGSDIINNSWGLKTSNGTARYSTTVRRAFSNAYKMNVVATVAMGNDELTEPGVTQYPAGFGQGIIAVGNTNRNDQRRFTSSTGNHIDVSAPGTSILSTVPEQTSLGYYGTMTGTSMATPHVSGIAGLLLAKNSSLYNDDIEQLIRLSTDKVRQDLYTYDSNGWNIEMGYGRVNAHQALLRLQSPYVLNHHTATGGYVANVTQETKVFYDTPGLATGTYIVKRNEVRKTVSFPYMSEAHVWGRGVATNGYSIANPNFAMGWNEPISVSNNSATLKTYVYEVFNTSGQRIGWFPTSPSNAQFAYTVHGIPGTPPLSVSISGPGYVQIPGTYSYSASASGGATLSVLYMV